MSDDFFLILMQSWRWRKWEGRCVEEKQKEDLCRYMARCYGESLPYFLSPKFDQFQILFIIMSDYHD